MKTTRVLFVVVIILLMFVAGDAFAASKPMRQLSADVTRWSSLWLAIPEQMVEIGQAHGPLAALIWGPAKGTALFARATVKEVWNTVTPNQQRGRRSTGRRPTGGTFRDEF